MVILCLHCKSRVKPHHYELTKCPKCHFEIRQRGFATKTVGIDRKLKVMYDSKNGVTILGNKAGLEFLALACLSVIRKKPQAEHWHLQWQMNTLLPDSIETIVQYSDNPKHYGDSLKKWKELQKHLAKS